MFFESERQFFQSFSYKAVFQDARIRCYVVAFTGELYINGALTLIRFYCNLHRVVSAANNAEKFVGIN